MNPYIWKRWSLHWYKDFMREETKHPNLNFGTEPFAGIVCYEIKHFLSRFSRYWWFQIRFSYDATYFKMTREILWVPAFVKLYPSTWAKNSILADVQYIFIQHFWYLNIGDWVTNISKKLMCRCSFANTDGVLITCSTIKIKPSIPFHKQFWK